MNIQEYAEGSIPADLVIHDGRVIDPETGRDEIASVSVKDGAIIRISAGPGMPPGEARQTIDASGRVVSPGFISTHTHEAAVTDVEENVKSPSNLYVFDGVTLWLGGNCGLSPTGVRVDTNDGMVIQSGNHEKPMQEFLDELDKIPLYNHYATLSGNITLRSRMGLKHMQKENDEQIGAMKALLAAELEAGSFGFSMGAMYDMGATRKALTELARVSREHGGMAAMHTRYPTFNLKHLLFGMNFVTPKRAIYEPLEICRETGVPFMISHITDMSQSGSTAWAMAAIDNAVREGLPVAGDILGSDFLVNDAYLLTFKGKIPVPLLMKLGNYSMSQFYAAQDYAIDGEVVMKQYEQCTPKRAEFLRKNIHRIERKGTSFTEMPLFCRLVPKEDTMLALQYPWAFIGSDAVGQAMDAATGEPDPLSPRGLATFSRLFGHWVREQGALSLQQAVFKASTAPAIWLGLQKKGRIQEGCDADFVVFDPNTIIDRAGWVDGTLNQKPDGISHVIVNGEVVVKDNRLSGATPGRLIRRTWTIPGNTGAVVSLFEESASLRVY